MPKVGGPKNSRAPDAARVARLMSQFDGLIKYHPMLMDHPEWSDDQCIEFARKWHAEAKKRIDANEQYWNSGIPYCRNIIKNENAQ